MRQNHVQIAPFCDQRDCVNPRHAKQPPAAASDDGLSDQIHDRTPLRWWASVFSAQRMLLTRLLLLIRTAQSTQDSHLACHGPRPEYVPCQPLVFLVSGVFEENKVQRKRGRI